MTIFGQSRLGRVVYAILLILMFGFDFVKDPIQSFIMSQHDEAARQLMTSPPPREKPMETASQTGNAANSPARRFGNGQQMPLMFKGQEEMIRQMAASGRRPTPEDLAKLKGQAITGAVQMLAGSDPAYKETADLVARRSTFETLYMLSAIAMTAITIVGLLYMVSSRLRDIGWPQYLLWALLAPVFLPKFLAIPLPAMAIQAIGVFFYCVLLTLAFIPSGGFGPPAYRPVTPPRIVVKRRPGQFGRLGTE
jgi:hypothetical protein